MHQNRNQKLAGPEIDPRCLPKVSSSSCVVRCHFGLKTVLLDGLFPTPSVQGLTTQLGTGFRGQDRAGNPFIPSPRSTKLTTHRDGLSPAILRASIQPSVPPCHPPCLHPALR